MNPWEQDWSSPQPASDAAPWEQDWNAPAEAAAPTPEQAAPTGVDPSYGERLGTAAGLGLKNLALGAEYGIEQTAATPVALAAGTADAAANMAGMASPLGLLAAVQGAVARPGSMLERAAAGADAVLGLLKPAPVSGAIGAIAPGALEFGLPGAQAHADETRAAIGKTNEQLAANKEDVGGDLLLDATTGLAQMAPAVGVGLATRSPKAAAAMLAGPMYGQTLAEGEGDVAQRAGRAAAFTGAEFVTELPVAKLLTVPLKSIVKETGQSGLKTALGRIGATAGKEFTQEAQTQVLQDMYDRGALDEDKSLGDMLADAGYAGLVGGIAGGVAGAPAAVATARQDSKATTDAGKARAAYEATFTETDDGQGGTTFVDGAGNPVGDTLDEARATAARLTPEEVAGRMAKTPSAPAAAPETPAAQAQLEPAPSPMQRGKPRIEPTLEPPATTEETSNEAGVQQPAPDMAAGRPGDAVSVSGSGETDGNPPAVGSGPDMGRVPGVQDEPGGTVGNTEGRGTTPSVMAPRSEPDAALTETSADPVASNAAPDFESTPDIIAIAKADTKAAKTSASLVMNRIQNDEQGVVVGVPTQLDSAIQRGDFTLEEAAAPWQATRDALKRKYGDTITLYRADAPASEQNPKTRLLFMAGKKQADLFAENGRATQPFVVPIDDIVAVNAKGGYYEFIVKKPGTSNPASPGKSQQAKPAPAAQPAAAPTQEQRNEEVSAQGQEPQRDGSGGSQVQGEPAQAQEEVDGRHKFPTLSKPLSRVIVSRKAIDRNTGREVLVKEAADQAMEDVESQIEAVRRVLACLKS